jgi:hypothetical protein
MKLFTVALIASVVTMAVGAATARPGLIPRPTNEELRECARWQDHRFEVCAAYYFWDAHVALQLYYKYVKSDSFLARLSHAPVVFNARYKGAARGQIKSMAAIGVWRTGTNDVVGPHIHISQPRSSLACDKAVIYTRERWIVRNKATGLVQYRDAGVRWHTVLLKRVPGELFVFFGQRLHAWDVFAIYDGRRVVPTCW